MLAQKNPEKIIQFSFILILIPHHFQWAAAALNYIFTHISVNKRKYLDKCKRRFVDLMYHIVFI